VKFGKITENILPPATQTSYPPPNGCIDRYFLKQKFLPGFIKIGGIEKLWEEYPKSFGRNWRVIENGTGNGTITEGHANSSSCYGLTSYWANMFRPFDDPDFPWFGLWFALPIVEIWYWCTDQV
jgi:hypothetical protein